MFLLFDFHLQLDCFDLTSNAIYQSQSELLEFTGYLDYNLPDDELQICQTQLINKKYNMEVFIGTSVFEIKDQTFTGENQTQFTLKCKAGVDCTYQTVIVFTMGSYQISFLDIDMTIEGTFGQLLFRVFDHQHCHSSSQLTYILGEARSEYYVTLQPHLRCKATPPAINPIYKTGFNKSVEGIESIIQQSPDIAVVAPNDKYVLSIGQIKVDCKNMLIPAEKQQCFDQLSSIIKTNAIQLYSIIQNDIQPIKTGHSPVYKQSFKTSIKNYLCDDFVDDCISSVSVMFFDDYIQLQINPGTYNLCGHDYFYLKTQYNKVNITVIASERLDFTGFVFEEYRVDNDFMHSEQAIVNFYCNETNNVSRCQNNLKQIPNLQQNISMALVLNYMKDDQLMYQIQQPMIIHQPLFDNCTVQLFANYICLEFSHSSYKELETVIIKIENLSMSFDVQFQVNMQTYCLNTTNDYYIIKDYENASVSIGNENIPQVFVDIILSGKQHIYAAIVFCIVLVVGVVILVAAYFIRNKQISL